MFVIKRLTGTWLLVAVISLLTPTAAHAATVGPPTALTVTSGNLEMALAWTAPAVGVNPAISDYTVEYSTDRTVWTQFIHVASVATTITVTGLTNSVEYFFRVAARNTDGMGSMSTAVAGTPLSNHTQADLPTYSACPPGIAPDGGFSDITSTSVDCIKYYEITKGTGDGTT